ncbi:type II toxin-antitoxin system Phd/YefM family antitoxin [Sporolactobacillus nakayamae]|uniref:Antitoxin Phd_YefM, type II toxin-antitoxin system n=1 Tax=Sporolactobacillus nakayamae TaxID=269670 RepID=A0A1I2W8H7_9BACL|nr:type II toxin-antitoxin system Phd/YefM family antitoxin [Sporolactobacillus nakayamae]SFG96939.1 Antitoxin Phd_YefM, type II toxin-antitoxin system [Sporolactobacillus nakayamae]
MDGEHVMTKPTFSEDQIIPSSIVVKTFSAVRKRAKIKPQVITDNQKFDSVILDYKQYEKMYERIHDLEDRLIYSEAAARIKEYDSKQVISLNHLMSVEDDARYQLSNPDDIADEDLFK